MEQNKECKGCGNKSPVRVHIEYTEGRKVEVCDRCGQFHGSAVVADVFFKEPYYDEHLAEPHNPNGFMGSRREKAEAMKRLDLQEAGDRKNKVLGRPMPYIADPVKRRKFFIDNFGGNG